MEKCKKCGKVFNQGERHYYYLNSGPYCEGCKPRKGIGSKVSTGNREIKGEHLWES